MGLTVLSAGAVKGGVVQIAAAFGHDHNHVVTTEFTQVPKLQKRLTDGEVVDVVVATQGAMDDLAKHGKIAEATRGVVGRSRLGIIVHKDAPATDVSDAEAFKRAVLAASCVVHNDASSGLYIAGLLEKLGLTAQLGNRLVMISGGPAMLSTLSERGPGTMGLAQMSAIRAMIASGSAVKLAGPLPDAIQNVSTYQAAAMTASAAPEAAAALARALTADAAKPVFAATGID